MFASRVPVPKSEQIGASKRRAANVLVLCSHASDRVRLREIFRRHGVRLCEAVTWKDGTEVLARYRPQVVICEAFLPDADWKRVLGQISLLKDAPRLIVLSSHADESLWSEVLNSGGYDLLIKPLVEDEVVRVVGLAWQDFN
jgi:PleD family two-component response regulator